MPNDVRSPCRVPFFFVFQPARAPWAPGSPLMPESGRIHVPYLLFLISPEAVAEMNGEGP